MIIKSFASKKVIAFAVALALFMDALDTTIINTAIPAMAHSLAVNPVDLKIALISYLLTLAIFLPISGWVADKYGIKKVFVTALAIFTLASLWCGSASTLLELVIARSVQGLGGSLMMPLGRLIILRYFERHEIVDAMSGVVMVVSLGMMLGPVAGGVITDHLSWHWIFWVNGPVGILAICAALIFLPKAAPRKVHRLDILGFLLFSSGLASLIFSLSYLSETSANQQTAWLILSISFLLLLSYVLHSQKQKFPLINTHLLKLRTFQISIIGNLLARLGFGGLPFLLPLLMQVGLGYSAQLSGLLMVPVALGVLMVRPLSPRLLRRVGFKTVLFLNTFLVGLSLWGFQLVRVGTSLHTIALLTFIFGLLISLQYSSMNSLAYSDVYEADHSAATSIVSTVQQLSQSLGVATAAMLLRLFSSYESRQIILTPTIFHQTFLAMGLFTFCCSVIFLRLKPNDGYQMLKPPTAAQEKLPVSRSL